MGRENGTKGQSVWTDVTVAEMQIYANAANLGADVKILPRKLLARGFTLKQIRDFRDSAREVGHRVAARTIDFNLDLIEQTGLEVNMDFIRAGARATSATPAEAALRSFTVGGKSSVLRFGVANFGTTNA
jgi:hypothetical protein